MAFVNRKLEENEIREYVLKWPREGVKARRNGGTIDDENNVRLFCYGNGETNKREPSDYYQFVFDYKGKVYFIELRRKLAVGDVVFWEDGGRYDWTVNRLTEEQKQSLREAMKVYAYEGFDIGEWVRKQKYPNYVCSNDGVTVIIEF